MGEGRNTPWRRGFVYSAGVTFVVDKLGKENGGVLFGRGRHFRSLSKSTNKHQWSC